jgi:hypothetical protein
MKFNTKHSSSSDNESRGSSGEIDMMRCEMEQIENTKKGVVLAWETLLFSICLGGVGAYKERCGVGAHFTRDELAPLPVLSVRPLGSCTSSCRLHWRSVSSSSMTLLSSLCAPAIMLRSTCHHSFLEVSCPFEASLLRCDRVLLFMFHLIVVIPRRFLLRNGCRSRASLRQHWRRT